jgi:hypothetical protein
MPRPDESLLLLYFYRACDRSPSLGLGKRAQLLRPRARGHFFDQESGIRKAKAFLKGQDQEKISKSKAFEGLGAGSSQTWGFWHLGYLFLAS